MGHPTALKEDDEHAALDAASTDERIKKVVAGRHARVLVGGVDAGRREPEGQRRAVVGYYDYATGTSVAAVVDLESQKVIDVEESPVQLQLSTEEAREAERIASEHPAVGAFLGGRKLNPLTRLYFPAWAERRAPPHRYAVVFARPSNHERLYAIVDLTDATVAEDLTPSDIKAQ